MLKHRTTCLLTTITAALAIALWLTSHEFANAQDPNNFNRLLKSKSERNAPPAKDGIHDAESPGVAALQPPKESFANFAKGKGGNYIDWVKTLEDGNIAPRYERLETDTNPVVMDLNIVREVKGSMPNVVYPHKAHTQWLDCSNCHPAIFIPQKGANQMSMASILLGEGCGVCHGKVAFPVSDCRRCHSQVKKDVSTTSSSEPVVSTTKSQN